MQVGLYESLLKEQDRKGEKEIQAYFKPLFHLVHPGREKKRGKEKGTVQETKIPSEKLEL